MSWSLTIGSLFGTAVRIHVTFILFLLYLFGASYASGGASTAWNTLLFMSLLFLCVLAHEFGHILTARAYGVMTPDVILLPIGGVARIERIPETPREEFLIAIAGPMVNVVIAVGLIIFAGAKLSGQTLATVENTRIAMVDRLAAVNLFLVLFNMIPAFPMDGGRVLRAILSVRLGFVRATEIAAMIGQWVAFALGFIGLFYSPMLIFIAIFVYLAASSEAHMVSLRAVSRGVPVSTAMMTQFATLTPEAPIEEAIETLLRTSQSEFPIVDADNRPIGLLTRADLIRVLKEKGPTARVRDGISSPILKVPHRSTLEEAVRILQERETPAVAVVDRDDRMVGLVSSETLGEMMMIAEAMPRGSQFGPWSRAAKPV